MAKPNQPGVWGIDVGQCALKALRLEMIDGKLTATAFDYVEHPKILSQPDADADQLTREALEKFLSRNTIRGDMVCISVPGQGGLARFVKLPPVEEKKITDIVKFEAKQQIPFRLEEVVWDFQKIGSGMVTDGFAMETEIGLFAMKRDMVNRYLQHFKDVDVDVHITQLAPLSLCNFVAYDLLHREAEDKAADEGEDAAEKRRCVVALDIGSDNSNLVITDAEKIIWQRPIPLGGNHFTRALTKDFKLTFAKAEHLKRNAIKSPELKKILASLKPVLNDFVGEVQRSLGYFTNTHRDAQVEYMVGLGNAFRLPGLQKFLSEKLQIEVKKLQKLERLAGDSVTTAPQFTENVLSFAVAYGLALQGLKLSRLHTNLLPHEIQIERMVKAKKPWAAAAAAALLIGVAGLSVSLAVANSKYDNPQVKAAVEKSKRAVANAEKFISECKSIEDSIAKKKTQTQQMAAGQAEQLNWSLLLQYINEALPRPNGDKIPPRIYDARARNANIELEKGTQMGEEEQQDLAQVNIEAILPLYTDDLSGYFQNLMKAKQSLEGMDEDQKAFLNNPTNKAKLPKAGWVVELRGYTYYSPVEKGEDGGRSKRGEPREFLKQTLCDNLSHPERVVDRAHPEKWNKKIVNDLPKLVASEVGLLATPLMPLGARGLLGAFVMKAGQPVLAEQILLSKKQDIVWQKAKYVVLFKYDSIGNPVPGQFTHIHRTLLKPLLETKAATGKKAGGNPQGGMPNMEQMRDGGMPGGGMQGGQPKGGNQGAAAKKPVGPDRSKWDPVGEKARAGFESGAKDAAKDKADDKAGVKRTEFHIFFVWEEPTPSEKPVSGPQGGKRP